MQTEIPRFADTFHIASRVLKYLLRFIPNYMTEKAVQERLIRLLETDWKAKAAILLEERFAAVAAGQEAYVSPLLSNCSQSRLLTMTRLLNFKGILSRSSALDVNLLMYLLIYVSYILPDRFTVHQIFTYLIRFRVELYRQTVSCLYALCIY